MITKVAKKKKESEKTLLQHAETEEKASVGDLDDYVTLLYEETEEKIRGTSLILQVAQNPDNLEEIINHEPLISVRQRGPQ